MRILAVAILCFPTLALADGPAGASAAIPGGVSMAEPLTTGAPDFDLHWVAGAASDYTFRGVSLMSGNPAFSAGGEVTLPLGLYARAWGTTINPRVGLPGDADAQVDLSGGYRQALWGGMVDAGVVEHVFLNSGPGLDFFEARLGAAHMVGPATVSGSLYWTPDFAGAADDAVYLESTVAAPVPVKNVTISAGMGHQWFLNGFSSSNYLTWNAGATYAINDHISVDGRYIDTDQHDFGKPFDSRLVASLKLAY